MSEYNLRGTIQKAIEEGVLDQLPPSDRKKMSGIIAYILSEQAVENLENTLSNIEKSSTVIPIIIQDAYVTGNLACAAGGLVIGGVSTQNFLQTKNRVAQFFYCGSIVCSGTAVIAGSFKAFGNVCGFSHLAIAGDFFGGGCLFLGNRSRKFGNYFEGKGGTDNLNPFRPRSFARRPKKGIGMGYKGMSFIASSDVPVSFQKIIVIGGTVFTIYCYGKLIISVYNYLHSKLLPKKNPSQAIHVSARFLTDSFKNTNYTERIQKV
jgi:hypothetical protein